MGACSIRSRRRHRDGLPVSSHRLLLLPCVALTYLLSNVLRGTERVRLPLYVSIVTTIANAFADYGLIFGAFGLPRLGVEGAAIATCISSWLGRC